MRAKYSILTAALVALLTPAPVAASLAVAICTSEQCIVGSDSRLWDVEQDRPAGDTATKIHVRGLYGVLVTHDPAPLSAAAHLPPIPGESAAALAHRILDAVPHGPRASESTIAVVRVQPFDAIVLHVRFHPDGRLDVLREAHPALPVALILGWPFADDAEMATITRRLTTELRTGPSVDRMIDMARDVLALGASRSPKIGGPSHVQVLDAVTSGGPIAWNGTGFWLDATSTPTFRVGNPSGNQIKWDGTNLTLGQGNVTIDSTGIAITPHTSQTFNGPNTYRWSVASGSAGVQGYDFDSAGTRTMGTILSAEYGVNANNSIQAMLSARSTQNSNTAQASALTTHNSAKIILTTTQNGTTNAGTIEIGGYQDFKPDGTTTAGTLCGYLVGAYQGDTTNTIRIPFYAASGGSCPTVP